MIPPDQSEADIIPGSLLSHASAFAAPDTFVWSRLMDAAMSIDDLRALDVHARVARWALDEAPLPGRLVHQIAEWLYRENQFCRSTLTVLGRTIGPSYLDVPTLAVVNTADEVAPLASIEPFLCAAYQGCLAHQKPRRDRHCIAALRNSCRTGQASSLGWWRIAERPIRRQTGADICFGHDQQPLPSMRSRVFRFDKGTAHCEAESVGSRGRLSV